MIIQILLIIFLFFALSRVLLRVREGKLNIGTFLFWGGLFVFAIIGVIEPGVTTYAANFVGIGRGADVVIYVSIVLLFYLIFRLSIQIEELRREISKLIRLESMKKVYRRKKRKKL